MAAVEYWVFESLRAWGAPAFSAELKAEIERLPEGSLSLPLVYGNAFMEAQPEVMLLRIQEQDAEILVDLGVFFSEGVVGCSCGDDPVAEAAYAELRLCLNKSDGRGRFLALPDEA